MVIVERQVCISARAVAAARYQGHRELDYIMWRLSEAAHEFTFYLVNQRVTAVHFLQVQRRNISSSTTHNFYINCQVEVGFGTVVDRTEVYEAIHSRIVVLLATLVPKMQQQEPTEEVSLESLRELCKGAGEDGGVRYNSEGGFVLRPSVN